MIIRLLSKRNRKKSRKRTVVGTEEEKEETMKVTVEYQVIK